MQPVDSSPVERERFFVSGPQLDQIARDLLVAERLFAPGEWAAVEAMAVELLNEARSLDLDPQEYAAARLVNLVATMNEDELDPDAEDLRVDIATATALVYVGRIG